MNPPPPPPSGLIASPYLPMHETSFCQKFLASTSNLHAEQNLVHLGRFCILAKKWLE